MAVDCFTKYAHFIALSHPYTALKIAQLFLDNICKLHGNPISITSDRDPIFTSLFWKELLMDWGYKLSSAQHTICRRMGKRKGLTGVWKVTFDA